MMNKQSQYFLTIEKTPFKERVGKKKKTKRGKNLKLVPLTTISFFSRIASFFPFHHSHTLLISFGSLLL